MVGTNPPHSFTKASPPRQGPTHGNWSGPTDEYAYRRQIAGGGLLQFDLSRITLADFRAMREHYQINISLAILATTMHQIDWSIEHPDARVRSFLEENLAFVWTRLIRGVSQAHWAGFSPMVLEYKNDLISGRLRLDKVKDLIPEECQVNWKKVDGYAPPGYAKPTRYLYDGIKQRGQAWPIPAEATLWYPTLMENGDYGGRKLLRPAFAPWFYSQVMHLYSNRYFERFGEPVIVGRAPGEEDVVIGQNADGSAITKPSMEIMQGIVENVRNASSVVIPNDRHQGTGTNSSDKDFEWTIDYLESQMRGADFERYMQRLDEEMSLGMFAPVLLFRTADVGSYNLGQAHEKIFAQMMNWLVGDMAQYLDRYVLRPLIDYNFSPNMPDAKFQWRQLGKDTDETLRAMVQAAIQQGSLKPDVQEIGQAVGMKFHEIEMLTATETNTPTTPDPNAKSQTKATISDISRRILEQGGRHWEGSGFAAGFAPSLGYRSKLKVALGQDYGMTEAQAHAKTDEVYAQVEAWLPEALTSSEGPEHFATQVELVLTHALAS